MEAARPQVTSPMTELHFPTSKVMVFSLCCIAKFIIFSRGVLYAKRLMKTSISLSPILCQILC